MRANASARRSGNPTAGPRLLLQYDVCTAPSEAKILSQSRLFQLEFRLQSDRLLRRLPAWLRSYVAVLAALTICSAFAVLLLQIFGSGAKLVISLMGDLMFLAAAWAGYGPGILVLALITFVVPRILTPASPAHVNLGQFGLLSIVSLIISGLSTSRRRTERSLRELAGQLETRVAERTAELRRNEEKRAWLAAIVESSDDAIIGQTIEGTITSWNRGAEALYGYPAHEIVGKSVACLIPSERADELPAILSRVRNGETVRNLETIWESKSGGRIPVSLTASPVWDAEGIVQGASTIAHDMTAFRQAAEVIAESERRYRVLFENNPQPMWVYDSLTLAFLTVNEACVQTYGHTPEEFSHMTLRDIRPEEEIPKLLEATTQPISGPQRAGTFRHRKKDGTRMDVEIAQHPIRFGDRDARLVLATDVTERTRLEEQFRQAQRLESVGRLAGGVAHDFNNLLTVINGFSELLLSEPETTPNTATALNQIRYAGERAADLTRQLLAFSRKQDIQPAVIDINSVLTSTKTLLRRLIGEDIELGTGLSPDLGLVLADPGQIQQIVMNLAVNSRDAMPNGGCLHIETSNVTLDEGYSREHSEVRPGSYIMLAVSDTGSGMTEEVRNRIFEPFFTTKELGKGTGLGLATVYGMVKQSGGWIWVYSEPGRGTTFKIYLPRADAPAASAPIKPKADVLGDETVLVVEDQVEVRALAVAGLSSFGYTVHGAASGREALEFCHEFRGNIDLVVTDVVMPDMNGREVAREIAKFRPTTKILFISGYTADVISHRGVLDAGVQYLQKPFTPDSLARKLREVLTPH